MKYIITLLIFIRISYSGLSQCTPVYCVWIPQWGGICDTVLATGIVNNAYSDFESFHISSSCFDAGVFSPSNAGTGIRYVRQDNFTYSGLPVGCVASTNQSSYLPSTNGCVAIAGIPAEVGLFKVRVNYLVDLIAYPFGCNSSFSVAQNDQQAFYNLDLLIKPSPTFTMPSVYCSNDASQTILITGTPGGTFFGPGISGNIFNPNLAGVGFHTIKYVVSLQQGAAVANAADSSSFTVQVVDPSFNYYIDADNDTYGDMNSIPLQSCNSSLPIGYSVNNLDCNDNNIAINPGANEVCDDLDNNCNGNIDEGLTLFSYYVDTDNDTYGDMNSIPLQSCNSSLPIGYSVNNLDCNDNNIAINPGANEVCDDLDNNCDGNIDEGLTLFSYYVDTDNDTYGDLNSIPLQSCNSSLPIGYSVNNLDCNDNNIAINPGANDLTGNSVDENCDGVDGNLSLNNEPQLFNILISPNPADNIVQLSGNLDGICDVRIFNSSGQKVFDCNIMLDGLIELNINDILPGSYIIEISHTDSRLHKFSKLLVIR